MGSSEIETNFKKVMSSISPITKIYKANFQVLPKFAFQLSISSHYENDNVKLIEKGVELALKISNTLQNISPDIYPRIGVSYSNAHVGNLGTKTSRYYTVIGSCVLDSEKLCMLADTFNVNVIIDSTCENSQSELYKTFILKPLDRIKKEYIISGIETIYQVFGKKNIENDEWLYELENSKKNDMFSDYNRAFSIFSSDFWSGISDEFKKEIEKVLRSLQSYADEHPEDVSTERLISVLKPCLNMTKSEENSIPSLLSTYYSSLDCKYISCTNVGSVRALTLDF